MSIWIAFAGGIILGWVIEWVIDWLYWRRGIAGFYATENELRGRLQNVQQEHTATTEQLTTLNGKFEEITVSKASVDQQLQDATTAKTAAEKQLQDITAAKATVDQQLQEALDTLAEARQPRRDDLEQIDGIGRVYEQKLFDAGVNTFAQLAITPVARLKEIIDPASWQQIDFESWLEQARRSAQVVIFDLLPYRLEEINGIGPAYAKRLNAEGIMTFADLADSTEERLRAIIPQRGGLTLDFAGWIKEARAFVNVTAGDRPPLPLERIKGIGPVFATRLDLAGIHTYADLAAADEEQLRGIIGTRGVQIANFSRWIEEAKAEGEGGPKTPAQTEPDAQSGKGQDGSSQASSGSAPNNKPAGGKK